MKVKIYGSFAKGSVRIPSSKSYLHRALIAASLANGKSVLKNVNYCDDINATIKALETMGAKFKKHKNYIEVFGTGGIIDFDETEIDCHESGSTLRFLIPLLSLCKHELFYYGKESLLKRPLDEYEKIFNKNGKTFILDDEYLEIEGAIEPGTYKIKGNISSQFITGLLFALPLLEEPSKIIIEGELESKSYVDMTMEILGIFGVNVHYLNNKTIYIEPNQIYEAASYNVECDYSNAAFFYCLAALNGKIKIENLPEHTLQGDREIEEIVALFGANFTSIHEDGIEITSSKLINHQIDLANNIDLGPILFVLSALSLGEGHFINTKRLKYKESDRALKMKEELEKCNIHMDIQENEIYILKGTIKLPKEFNTHNDHRIAMSLAVLICALNKTSIINDAEVVNKSYPNFYKDLEKLGIKVEYLD